MFLNTYTVQKILQIIECLFYKSTAVIVHHYVHCVCHDKICVLLTDSTASNSELEDSTENLFLSRVSKRMAISPQL